MKKLLYALLIGLVFISAITPSTQKKIALIVAIGDYPEGGRWSKLSSLSDMRYVKSALVKSGFDSSNIDTLVNKDATKKGIVKALDDLYNKVSEGDIVYFHFSGHGQQIEDDNGDEADGYDEALICYDAAAAYDPVTYHGENHLRDDLLGEKLNRIRKKIGAKGSLVVLIDACHSGTATRGKEDHMVKRGTSDAFASPGYKPNIKIDLNAHPEEGMLEGFTDGMGSMVVFSACSPNQPNYEVKDAESKGVGSLSYAFAKSIADLPAESNYHVLFQKIKAFVQGEIATQIPMVEGNLDLEVFGGKYIAKPASIAVEQRFNNASNKFNDTTFIINQGQLNSINKGTTLKIYPVGSNEVYAEGIVSQVSSFQSICLSNKPLKKNAAYEVKIDAASGGEFSAALFIQNNDGKSKMGGMIESQFKNDMKPYQYLSLSNNPDYTVDIAKEPSGAYKISLLEKGDSVRYVKTVTDSLSQDDFKYFLNGIKRSMRVKYLRNMADGGNFGKYIKVEIVPKVKQTNQ
ncbi:MAG: caspase family protein, partial [Chitinophagaceae bacterium]|nr:caspase family protein [Chitinophagaceae bacterium]